MCNFFLKEEVDVEFLFEVGYIRFSFGYLRKQPTISLLTSDFSKSGRE